MKFGQLILRRIVKIVATKMSDFKAKIDLSWGSAQTQLGELTALPRTP